MHFERLDMPKTNVIQVLKLHSDQSQKSVVKDLTSSLKFLEIWQARYHLSRVEGHTVTSTDCLGLHQYFWHICLGWVGTVCVVWISVRLKRSSLLRHESKQWRQGEQQEDLWHWYRGKVLSKPSRWRPTYMPPVQMCPCVARWGPLRTVKMEPVKKTTAWLC